MSKNGINNITLPVYKEAIETVKGMVPGFQTTFAIAISLLINLSGWELTNFKVVDVSTAQYTIKQIVNAEDDSVLSEKRAKDYLKAMTGSEYLPKYSYEKPTYTYIIAENVIWKVQYDSQQGLLMYKMIELPTGDGGTKLYTHYFSFSGALGETRATGQIRITSAFSTPISFEDIPVEVGGNILTSVVRYNAGQGTTLYYATILTYLTEDGILVCSTTDGNKVFTNATLGTDTVNPL